MPPFATSKPVFAQVLQATLAWWLFAAAAAPAQSLPDSSEAFLARHGSIQAAIDKSPGRMVFLPPGDYAITNKLRLHTSNGGLHGYGRIILSNPADAHLVIERATNVQIRDLTFTRAEGKMDAKETAILVMNCSDVTLDNVRVIDSRAQAPAIQFRDSTNSTIRNCTVQNYMRVGIDDRTQSKDWGYAFQCIDGTGIDLAYCRGALIQGNRIVELNLLPTRAIQEKFKLGNFSKKNAEKGLLLSDAVWQAEYVNNWHQGAALHVGGPEASENIQIIGNYIQNAAQGIDIHGDNVTVAQNIVNNAFVGMKAMHGSRNTLIVGNQFIKNDLWSIGLMPGAGSHYAGKPAHGGVKPEETAANVDGGSIIANNIISDFGYGHAHWIWGNNGRPILLDHGQKAEGPPLNDVIIQGNVLYDTGRDQVLEDGKPRVEPPRYIYSIYVSPDDPRGLKGPTNLHFSNNLLHPGTRGVSNVELKP